MRTSNHRVLLAIAVAASLWTYWYQGLLPAFLERR